MNIGKTPSFITPYGKKNWSKKADFKSPKSPRTLQQKVDKVISEEVKDSNSSNALYNAGKLLTVLSTPKEVLALKLVLGTIENGINSLANASSNILPYWFQQSSSDIDSTKIHVVRFNVGHQSTKSVKAAESIAGSTTLQLSNSLSECQDLKTRSLLNRSFGFNQKTFDFLKPKFYVSVMDYLSLFDVLKTTIPMYGDRVPYGLVIEEYSNVKIRNSNTYHKLKFTIHLIKILDDDVTIGSLYSKVTNKLATRQDNGCIPKVYQIEDAEETNEFIQTLLCYYGCTLTKSPAFKTQARIVKSFTRLLNPGDTFDFRMHHHMGPGIRLDLAKTFLLAGGKGYQPSGYGIIVECEGTMCQGMRLKDKAVFQGNCPGWYNYEFSKGVKLVRSTDSSRNYAVKYYDRQYLSNPPITFAANVIGRPDEKNKEFTVLSTSKQHVVFGTNIVDAINEETNFNNVSNIVELNSDFDTEYKNEILDEG